MKYVKKPEVIEALQFTGNDMECMDFCPIAFDPMNGFPELVIRHEGGGETKVVMGDYICKDDGDFFVLRPAYFEKNYEVV